MKNKKILVVLLVLLLVMGLVLTVVACKPPTTDPKKPSGPNNKDKDPVDEEAPIIAHFTELVTKADNTIRDFVSFNDEAYYGATIYAQFSHAGNTTKGVKPINVDIEIALKAALSKSNPANNTVLVEIKDNSTKSNLGVVGALLVKTVEGKEIVYLGQRLLNNNFTWVKFAQAGDAKIISKTVIDLLVGIKDTKIEEGKAPNIVTKTLSEKAEAGILNGMIGGIIGVLPMLTSDSVDAAETKLLKSNDADNIYPATKGTNGMVLKLKTKNLGNVAGALGAFVNFEELATTMTESGVFSLVDTLVGIILGRSYTDMFVTPVPPADDMKYPILDIAIGYRGDHLSGLSLHYDYSANTELPLKVGIGIKDLVIEKAAKAIAPTESASAVASAKDASIELGANILLRGGADAKPVQAEIRAYVYPDIKFTMNYLYSKTYSEDMKAVPFAQFDFTNMKGYATIRDASVADSEAVIFADFNQKRKDIEGTDEADYAAKQNGARLNLEPVLKIIYGSEYDATNYTGKLLYFLDADLQKEWDEKYAENTKDFQETEPAASSAPLNAENLIDQVIKQINKKKDGKFDFIGLIGMIIDKNFLDNTRTTLKTLVTEVADGGDYTTPIRYLATLTKEKKQFEAEADFSKLMANLLAGTGLIKTSTETKIKSYYAADGTLLAAPEEKALADYLAKDQVLASIANLVTFEMGKGNANDAWREANKADAKYKDAEGNFLSDNFEADLALARDIFFGKQLEAGQTAPAVWKLEPVTGNDLWTVDKVVTFVQKLTGVTLDPADAYAGLNAYIVVTAGEQNGFLTTALRGGIDLMLSINKGDDQALGIEVAFNIVAEDQAAKDAYLNSDFANKILTAEGYIDTSVETPDNDWNGLKTLLMNEIKKFVGIPLD